MKKIKGLLLFGILTLLGIGSSFGVFFDLRDNTGSQLLIPNYSYTYKNWNYYSTYNYTLGNVSYHSGEIQSLDNRAVLNLYVCRDSNSSILGFANSFFYTGNNTIEFGDFSNCSSFNELTNFDYLYVRNDFSISPYSLRKNGPITRYLYFDNYNYYTYSQIINDVPSGYTRQKLFLSLAGNYGSVSSDSSGNYLLTSLFDDSFSISYPIFYTGYILLHFGGYDLDYYNGAGTLLLSLGDDEVYFNYYTGFYINYSDILPVDPSLKGVLTYNNSSSEGHTQFINFLNNGDKIVLTNGSIGAGLTFTSYGYNYFTQTNQGGGYFTKSSNYSFIFHQDDSVPTFIEGYGGFSDMPFGIFGTDSLFYYCNVNSSTRDSSICLNPDGTSKSDEELKNCYTNTYINMSGGQSIEYSQYYCIDSNGLIQDIELVESGAGVIFAPCQSDSCRYSIDFSSLGLTGYSEDFFDGYLNKTGYFFKCPWNYDSNLTIWPKLVDLLNGVDILLPVNCSIAGFHHGKNLINFSYSGSIIGNGPLLNFEGENRKSLYLFFDILISIGIVLFVGKIFYLFHK